MTTTVGELNVKIEADLNSIKASMGELKDVLTKSASKAHSTTKKMESDLSFVALRSKVEVAARAVGKAYQLFIEPAIRAEEAQSKFNVIFKKNAANITEWSNKLAPQIARSSRELRDMATNMMAMLDTMSRSTEEAVEMSKGFVLLAQDLSSFHDIPVEEAFEKLRAGVAGEIEPLRRLGILLDESTLKEEMHRQGLKGKFEELSQGEKTMLRYNAIVRKSGEALGDATRTAESTQNQVRRLSDSWRDFCVMLGETGIPIFDAFIKVLNDSLGKINKWLELTGQTKKLQDTTREVKALGEEIRHYAQSMGMSTFEFMKKTREGTLPIAKDFQDIAKQMVSQYDSLSKKGLTASNSQDKYNDALTAGVVNMSQYGDKTKSAAGRVGELAADMKQFIYLLLQGKAGLVGFGEADPWSKAEAKFNAFVEKYKAALAKMTAAQRKQVEDSNVLIEANAASQEEAMNEWFSKFNTRLQGGFSLTNQAMGQISGLFDQYWSNRNSEVDADYQHKKNVINATIADEEDRNMLQAQLEAKYQEDKRRIAVKEAKRRKVILLAQTFIETQSGALQAFVSALSVAPYPYNLILGGIAAGVVQVLGAAKMAMIASQKIPEAAKGAYARTATPVIFGEAGPEGIFPLTRDVFRAFAEGIVAEAGLLSDRTTAMSQSITTNNYYNTNRNINLNLDGRTVTTVVDRERDARAYNMGATNYAFGGAY